jgi:uncharacterized membrane protein
MNGTFPILPTFLARVIEGVEMMSILVGVGATCGWRSAFLGTHRGLHVCGR